MYRFQNISNNLCRKLPGGSTAGYLYFVYVSSVSIVKVAPKSHQLPILLILGACLILNTEICTYMVCLET